MKKEIYIDQWGHGPYSNTVIVPFGDNDGLPPLAPGARRFKVEIELPEWDEDWPVKQAKAVDVDGR